MSDLITVNTAEHFYSSVQGIGTVPLLVKRCFNLLQKLYDLGVRTGSNVVGAVLLVGFNSIIFHSSGGWTLDRRCAERIYERLATDQRGRTPKFYQFIPIKSFTSYKNKSEARRSFADRTQTIKLAVAKLGSPVAWSARLVSSNDNIKDGSGAIPDGQWDQAAWKEVVDQILVRCE